MYRRPAGNHELGPAVSSARRIRPFEAGAKFMDPKIGDASGIDSDHRQLRDPGLSARDESHAAFGDYASQDMQAANAPVDVHFHEKARTGSANRHSSRNR